MKAHIIGGGFGGLAAAALLIRNARMSGPDITIYEADEKLGGGFLLAGDAVAELLTLQAEYAAWCEVLPDSLRTSATAEALQAIVELDLDELAAIAPPRGFGRD